MRDLVRAQADDGEDAEEPQAQARAHRRIGQDRRHREHADVHAEEGGHQVGAAVAWEVESENEDEHGREVDADHLQGAHWRSSVGNVLVTINYSIHVWEIPGLFLGDFWDFPGIPSDREAMHNR